MIDFDWTFEFQWLWKLLHDKLEIQPLTTIYPWRFMGIFSVSGASGTFKFLSQSSVDDGEAQALAAAQHRDDMEKLNMEIVSREWRS